MFSREQGNSAEWQGSGLTDRFRATQTVRFSANVARLVATRRRWSSPSIWCWRNYATDESNGRRFLDQVGAGTGTPTRSRWPCSRRALSRAPSKIDCRRDRRRPERAVDIVESFGLFPVVTVFTPSVGTTSWPGATIRHVRSNPGFLCETGISRSIRSALAQKPSRFPSEIAIP
jgi:hypothetical protein